jgi:hypothetical protein
MRSARFCWVKDPQVVGAPESRLLPTEILIAFGLASRKGDTEPGS